MVHKANELSTSSETQKGLWQKYNAFLKMRESTSHSTEQFSKLIRPSVRLRPWWSYTCIKVIFPPQLNRWSNPARKYTDIVALMKPRTSYNSFSRKLDTFDSNRLGGQSSSGKSQKIGDLVISNCHKNYVLHVSKHHLDALHEVTIRKGK